MVKEHARRADKLVYVFYALALVAAVSIFAPAKWPKSARALALTTLVLGIVSLSIGSYIAHAGGRLDTANFEPHRPRKLSSRLRINAHRIDSPKAKLADFTWASSSR
jgi:hypothetical protein